MAKLSRHKKRRNSFLRNNTFCVYCDKNTRLTQDHIIPHSIIKSKMRLNYIAACAKCNSMRGNTSILTYVKTCHPHKLEVIKAILETRISSIELQILYHIEHDKEFQLSPYHYKVLNAMQKEVSKWPNL